MGCVKFCNCLFLRCFSWIGATRCQFEWPWQSRGERILFTFQRATSRVTWRRAYWLRNCNPGITRF